MGFSEGRVDMYAGIWTGGDYGDVAAVAGSNALQAAMADVEVFQPPMINDGDKPKPQPRPKPQGGAADGSATRPRETAREALQQSMDRRW